MGNLYLGDTRIETDSMYLGDVPLFEKEPIFIGDDGKKYYEEDCHIFVANDNAVNLPIPNGTTPTFLTVDGVEKNYETEVKGNVFNESIIYAIFDWDNKSVAYQNWFSDILQFGLNSETKQRNQIKSAVGAFYYMKAANPVAISNLNTSNLTNMNSMFNSASDFNSDISGWDTSKVLRMDSAFIGAENFNQDISGWDTSNVERMSGMFKGAKNFDQDISGWDTSKVLYMSQMFYQASKFNQDLSEWCVIHIDVTPDDFDNGATDWKGGDATRPPWGYCPRRESAPNIDDILPNPYVTDDCHVFVTNGSAVNLPIPSGSLPTFLAVDGEQKDYETEVKGKTFDGSIIHAIFDWDNANTVKQDWFSEIRQFGSNSVTGERKQLKNGYAAFYYMEPNPGAISRLNVSNVTNMNSMFYYAKNFNRYIPWNVSNVTTMNNMFYYANQFKSPDMSGWDTSNVKDMSGMCQGSSFNSDISSWDTSNVENMSNMFSYTPKFNQPIGKWNVSNVTDMTGMFLQAQDFNKDISQWDTSKVERMNNMFANAWSFNQDLSQWCVSKISSKPGQFDHNAYSWTLSNSRPDWGKCPRFENIFPITGNDGKEYGYADAHVFIANDNTVTLPTSGSDPIFLAVDGVKKDYKTEVYNKTFPGSTIHAICDWNNENFARQNWFSDILKFGSRSVGYEPPGYIDPPLLPSGRVPNQLWVGIAAFSYMEANPAAIASLDVSNLLYTKYMFEYSPFNQDISGWDTSNINWMQYMFQFATEFNQDISGWDTSKVVDMDYMFDTASNFNQDLSKWCVSLIDEFPEYFDWQSGFFLENDKQPQWGECPRGEDGS